MMMKVLCQKNCANGLRTAIKTHGTLFVHQRKGKRSFTAPSVPLTLHVLTEAKVIFVVIVGTKTTFIHTKYLPYMYLLKTGARVAQ
jgi:hypothetical protein